MPLPLSVRPDITQFRITPWDSVLFNNVAVAARYLQREHGGGGVFAIIDWDVHHGNGTQDVFFMMTPPFFFLLSASGCPLYPGTGMGKRDRYRRRCWHNFEHTDGVRVVNLATTSKPSKNTLKPALLDFSPDFLIISAGFDAHRFRPFGGDQYDRRWFLLV